MCSWRLALHPYVQSAFYPVDRYDVHWFAPENLAWLTRQYGSYYRLATGPIHCDADSRARLVAIVGPGTAFPDDYGFAGEVPEDTLFLIEWADSEVAWMQPGDLDVATCLPRLRRESTETVCT